MKATIMVTLAMLVTACGNNIVVDDASLQPADMLFVAAHFDDDEIFMQPELANAIEAGRPITTVFVTSGDPIHGVGRELHVFEAARVAYGKMAGADDWQCGYTMITGLPVRQCRLPDQGISLLALDVPDGGIEGTDNRNSLLHLLDGKVDAMPLLGQIGGYTITRDQLIDELGAIITATAPAEIHTLDIGGTHGYDNSSHVLSASFVLWAAASVGFTGDIRTHRGYNVAADAPTFTDGTDYARAAYMLGFFDACYLGCGPCGTSCVELDVSHHAWLQRQYSTPRMLAGSGVLALAKDASECATANGNSLVLGECPGASPMSLAPNGHLEVAGGCIAANDDGSVTIAACAATPAQYWLLDGEGNLWNGQPVHISIDTYHPARCLHAEDAPSAAVTAPICGLGAHTSWSLVAPW
jgi:hypothetical protein